MNTDERNAVRERLAAIAAANGGRLEVDHVIEDARDEDSPLHGRFNWNEAEAALEHWRDTARKLIASVRIIERTDKMVVSTIAYVRDPMAGSREQGYVSTAALRTQTDLARMAATEEYARAAAAMRRAREVAEALGVQYETDRIIGDIEGLRQRVAAPEEAAA